MCDMKFTMYPYSERFGIRSFFKRSPSELSVIGLLSIRLVRIHSLHVLPALIQFALLMF